MSYSHFICRFSNRAEFNFNLSKNNSSNEIPIWSCFKNFPCPGNVAHGPDIEYCRLARDVHTLISYFSNIQSYERGCIHIFEGETDDDYKELIIHRDAQNIFFYATWLILIKSPCSVFKCHQKLRENYVLTTNTKKLFYTFFSIFLVDSHFSSPDQGVQLMDFKKQLQLFQEVLNNLLERMRQNFTQEADAANNGLVLLNSLVLQVEEEMEVFYKELELKVKQSKKAFLSLSLSKTQ